MTLEDRVKLLETRLNQFEKSGYFTLQKDFQVVVKTGIRIGTAPNQKLSVFGVKPVVQAGAINAPSSPGTSYNQSVAQSAVDAINSIRTAIKNFGITA